MLITYLKLIHKYVTRFLQNRLNNVVWFFNNNSKNIKVNHLNWLLEQNKNSSNDFVKINETDFIQNNNDPKLIAFYLPQYHENKVNDENFGRGFMEWYNTTKTIPQYTGHYQPQLPIDVGFYNLTDDRIMYRQIELAKKYGIYGFCFYHYWFSGDRLLDKPLDNFIKNKELKMPFCLFWANETWTNTWQGGDAKIIIKKQELLENDDEKFSEEMIKYFSDERYIKVKNKPLLIIYKYNLFNKDSFKTFLKSFKQKVVNAGFPGVCILTTDVAHREIDISDFEDIDGVVEFSHQDMITTDVSDLLDMKNKFVNPNFRGRIIDIEKCLNKKRHLVEKKYKNYKCPACGWDNSARKAYSNALVFHMSPVDFKRWLKDIVLWTKEHFSNDEQIVFIDSWNEWAEGAHLEPCQKYGYAYLDACRTVLEETR